MSNVVSRPADCESIGSDYSTCKRIQNVDLIL